MTETRQAPYHLLITGTKPGPHRRRARHQGRSFATDHLLIAWEGHLWLPLKGHIEVLSLGHFEQCNIEQFRQLESSCRLYILIQHPPEMETRQRQHSIADENRLGNAPERPDCGTMTALDVSVLNIIMQQRKIMSQLDGSRRGQCWP